MTDAAPQPDTLQRLWLSEAIRLREEHAGPLDDAEANRLARAGGGDLASRIQQRALLLARRDGQWQALLHWLQGARLALLLAALALLSGVGLALAGLGDGSRPVNVFWALGSLLGLNFLLLLAWLPGKTIGHGIDGMGLVGLNLESEFHLLPLTFSTSSLQIKPAERHKPLILLSRSLRATTFLCASSVQCASTVLCPSLCSLSPHGGAAWSATH